MSSPTCLVIGAGLCGLTAALELQRANWSVEVWDKGRVPGGRMSTRCFAGESFDSGAQFFTVRDERFRKSVDGWVRDRVARVWFEREGHQRYCGVGGMNAVPRHLAKDLNFTCEYELSGLTLLAGGRWSALSANGNTAEADAIILTAPVPQSLALLDHGSEQLRSIRYHPCIALMLATDEPSAIPDPGYLKMKNPAIASVGDHVSKHMARRGAVTIHASAEWSRTHWDDPDDILLSNLLKEVQQYIRGEVLEWSVKKWRYSQAVEPFPERCCLVKDKGLAVYAGDAFGEGRVEGAFLSGLAAAEALLNA